MITQTYPSSYSIRLGSIVPNRYPTRNLELNFQKGDDRYVGPTSYRIVYANVPGVIHMTFDYPGYCGIVRYDRHVTKDSAGGCIPLTKIVYNDMVLSDDYSPEQDGIRFVAGGSLHFVYNPRPEDYLDGQIAVVAIVYDAGVFRSSTDPDTTTLPIVDLGANGYMEATLKTDNPVFRATLLEYSSKYTDVYYDGTLVAENVYAASYGIYKSMAQDLKSCADSIVV